MKGLELGNGASTSLAAQAVDTIPLPTRSDGSPPRSIHLAFLTGNGLPLPVGDSVTFALESSVTESGLAFEEPIVLYCGGTSSITVNNYTAATTVNVFVTALDYP